MNYVPLPAATQIGAVTLRVGDLDRSLGFYRDLIGFNVVSSENQKVALAPPGVSRPLMTLIERPDARPRTRHYAGLYHTAILLPSRKDLGTMLLRLIQTRTPMHGASDHAVSEALYLPDPDGNGVEIYADRPREVWENRFGEVQMTTKRLDIDGLLAEADEEKAVDWELPKATIIGHMHLQVSSMRQAEDFYNKLIGFDVTTRSYPGALFMSAGGYHHHLGLNTWSGEGIPPTPEDVAGLVDFSLRLPHSSDAQSLVQRLRSDGAQVTDSGDDRWTVQAPDGVQLILEVA